MALSLKKKDEVNRKRNASYYRKHYQDNPEKKRVKRYMQEQQIYTLAHGVKPNSRKTWTTEEDHFLSVRQEKMTLTEMAIELGRTYFSVMKRLQKIKE